MKGPKNNKAPSKDGLTAEILKASRDLGAKIVTENLKTAIIHPLHKKGDKVDINNTVQQ